MTDNEKAETITAPTSALRPGDKIATDSGRITYRQYESATEERALTVAAITSTDNIPPADRPYRITWEEGGFMFCGRADHEVIDDQRQQGLMSNNDRGDLQTSLTIAHDELVAAVRGAWDHCEQFYDEELQLGRGGNLPELLRGALTEVGREVGGTDGLVRHRPGSWEAGHVVSLGAIADPITD